MLASPSALVVAGARSAPGSGPSLPLPAVTTNSTLAPCTGAVPFETPTRSSWSSETSVAGFVTSGVASWPSPPSIDIVSSPVSGGNRSRQSESTAQAPAVNVAIASRANLCWAPNGGSCDGLPPGAGQITSSSAVRAGTDHHWPVRNVALAGQRTSTPSSSGIQPLLVLGTATVGRPSESQRRTRGDRGKSPKSSVPVSVPGSMIRRLPSASASRTSVPGVPVSSRPASISSTQSPAAKPSAPSRPGLDTVSSLPLRATQRVTTDPFSRDHLNVAVPTEPPSWISTR